MNNYQNAKLDSNKLVVTESKNNPESIAKVPTFATTISKLEEINQALDRYRIDQEKDLTGITADKMASFEDLIDFTIEFSGAVYSYAAEKRDHALMSVVNFKPSIIGGMTQSDVVNTAGIVLKASKKLSANDLAQEGISAEDITSFETLIDYFKSIKTSNREAVIDRSSVTSKINDLFEEANSLVKNKLDRLAVQFKRKDPDFYLKYKAARNVNYPTANKKVDADAVADETIVENAEVQ